LTVRFHFALSASEILMRRSVDRDGEGLLSDGRWKNNSGSAVPRTIASLRSSGAFRTWFYRIVVREAAELKRRRSRTEPTMEAPVSADDQAASIDVWRALIQGSDDGTGALIVRQVSAAPLKNGQAL
jgi:hypothetical protein